jgi:NAD(P)-dependent dehydrogenase (short-subunit alcohol dehydrogenase family)
MALERAPKRARVNATAPGHFATEMTEMTEDYLSRLPARARHAARHPDERFGEESELDGGLLLRAPKNCVHAVARRERGERREAGQGSL